MRDEGLKSKGRRQKAKGKRQKAKGKMGSRSRGQGSEVQWLNINYIAAEDGWLWTDGYGNNHLSQSESICGQHETFAFFVLFAVSVLRALRVLRGSN
ncbi:hypothetical protein JOD20_004406 [Herpetosiphon giganteus]|nr:hypothetical protein [Herpetosiphon giganteus]